MNPQAGLTLMAVASAALILAACSSNEPSRPAAVASSPSTAVGSTGATPTATPSAPSVSVRVDPVDAAFRTKVGDLCVAWLADGNKHAPPFYMGNPLALTAAQLPQAAGYLDSLAVNHELVSATSTLGEPSAGKEAWARLQAGFRAFVDHQAAAIAAAKASDLAAWTTTAAAADTARDAIYSGLGDAGFPASDACRIVFTRPDFHGN